MQHLTSSHSAISNTLFIYFACLSSVHSVCFSYVVCLHWQLANKLHHFYTSFIGPQLSVSLSCPLAPIPNAPRFSSEICLSFFLRGKLQSGALPYWWLDAKRHYLLPSCKPSGPRSSRTEGHHRLSSARWFSGDLQASSLHSETLTLYKSPTYFLTYSMFANAVLVLCDSQLYARTMERHSWVDTRGEGK